MKQLVIVVFALILSLVGNSQVAPTKLYISSVNNLIKVGPLTNNTNLAFGVKNVLEEATQDKGYSIAGFVVNPYHLSISFSAPSRREGVYPSGVRRFTTLH